MGDKMNGIEIYAIRNRIGLTREELATLISTDTTSVTSEDIEGFENERQEVNAFIDFAVSEVYEIWDDRIEDSLATIDDIVEEMTSRHNNTPQELQLYIYQKIEDFDKAGGQERYRMTWEQHTAYVTEQFFRVKALIKIEELPIKVALVPFTGELHEPTIVSEPPFKE